MPKSKPHHQQYAILLEELDITAILADVGGAVAGRLTERYAPAALADLGVGALLSLSQQTLGMLAAPLASELLRALLTKSDKLAERFDRLEFEPVRISVELARAALALEAETEDEVAFRVARLQDAIDRLREAQVRVHGIDCSQDLLSHLHMLCGLCAASVPGGSRLARVELAKCMRQLERDRARAVASIAQLARLEAKAEDERRMRRSAQVGIGSLETVVIAALVAMQNASAERGIAAIGADAATLTDRIRWIDDLLLVLSLEVARQST